MHRVSVLVSVGTNILRNHGTNVVMRRNASMVQQKKFIGSISSSRKQLHKLDKSYDWKQDCDSTSILSSSTETDHIKVQFSDGTKAHLPHLWLRDNCQCPNCFDKVALGRKFLLMDLSLNARPEEVRTQDDLLEVIWNDGHISNFDKKWIHQRSFTDAARDAYKKVAILPKEFWGPDERLQRFNYCDLMEDRESLLEWLMVMESKGAAIVTNTPRRPSAGAELIENFAVVKYSHYGRSTPVINRVNSNNVAFSSLKLGLHNDLAQYYHQAGIIFIQAVKQHEGEGGDSVTSDGFKAAQILRENHPEYFEILTKTNVYFWDKGIANVAQELDKFYKITIGPVIRLNGNGELERISMNNQVRDSHFDITWNKVKPFYQALIIFNKILYDNSLTFKMETGEMLTLDNERCLHGRKEYSATSDRHIESCYCDWDEVRCYRRRLQEELYGCNLA